MTCYSNNTWWDRRHTPYLNTTNNKLLSQTEVNTELCDAVTFAGN